jgi:hypothetical protein
MIARIARNSHARSGAPQAAPARPLAPRQRAISSAVAMISRNARNGNAPKRGMWINRLSHSSTFLQVSIIM